MAKLIRESSGAAREVVDWVSSEILVGRGAKECQIVVENDTVSRKNNRFLRDGDQYFVEALENSRNPSLLNSRKLTRGQLYPLRHGDILSFSGEVLDKIRFFNPSAVPLPIVPDSAGDETIAAIDASTPGSSFSDSRLRAKFHAILELSETLSGDFDKESIATKGLDRFFQMFPQTQHGFLALRDPDNAKQLVVLASRSGSSPAIRPAPSPSPGADLSPRNSPTLSRTIANQVLNQVKAVLTRNAGELPVGGALADGSLNGIQSMMCVPLLSPERTAVGVVALDTNRVRQFTREDLEILAVAASVVSVALANAYLHAESIRWKGIAEELKAARAVLRAILPRDEPSIPGYEWFNHYEPATEVGGDFYDFQHLADNRLAFALGDVTGHGMAAALLMARFFSESRSLIRSEAHPALTAHGLNRRFCAAEFDSRFITLGLGILSSTDHRLTYTSAGHEPLIIRRANGRLEEIIDGGPPVGVMQDASFEQVELEIDPGDVIILYSDGLTTARNPKGEFYHTKSRPRLLEDLQGMVGGAQAIGRRLVELHQKFTAGAGRFDDLTIVCIGRHP